MSQCEIKPSEVEPQSGFEPETSSFVYTPVFLGTIRGLDCILGMSCDEASLVSRSGVRFRVDATVLTLPGL